MVELLKKTYLLDVEGVSEEMERHWARYQEILDLEDASWRDLNEARAILYILGYLFPEKIALESIESRTALLVPPLEVEDFLRMIDTDDIAAMQSYREDRLFHKLKDLYIAVKSMKNRVKGGSFLDEERFNKVYGEAKPDDFA